MNIPRPKLGLFWKVYLNGLILLILVAGTVIATHTMIPNDADSEWLDIHLRLANHIAEHTSEIAGDRASLEPRIKHLRHMLGVDLSYYRLDGTLIASNVDPPLRPLDPGELQGLAAGTHCTEHTMWHVIAPIMRDGDVESYLVLEDAERSPSRRNHIIALTILTVLIVLALASIPLAAAITRPLERLTQTAVALGKGDLRARSGLARTDEVGRLATAFDEMAERMERLLAAEKELLANVSHELRTPLARIRVALDIASEGDFDRARATIADIASDLEELERIVGDLLTAARLELDRSASASASASTSVTGAASGAALALRRERIPVGELIDRSAAKFRTVHPERSLAVSIVGEGVVHADVTLLRRAVDNLLDNARKYSDQDRPIELGARVEEKKVVVEVRDEGIGIDRADLPHVFTPFFRTDRSRARTAGGVGLGLTLARRIVEAHGGEIAIESEPGRGTLVRVVVPTALDAAAG